MWHEKRQNDKVIAVDLGILCLSTCLDGIEVISYHGGIPSSLIRYRNKEPAKFQQMLNQAKKGSNEYRKLIKAKKKMLRRVRDQIKDILHNITSNFLKMFLQKVITTIALGDITNIWGRL